MPLIQISSPAAQPITVDAVKMAARLDDDAFDSQIDALIKAYTKQAEDMTGRAIIRRTFELRRTHFPDQALILGMPDVTAIDSAVYIDQQGAEQLLDPALWVLTGGLASSLTLAPGKSWPAIKPVPEGIRIRFTAGLAATTSEVPDNIALWIKAHCIRALESPSGVLASSQTATGLDALLDAYRTYGGV